MTTKIRTLAVGLAFLCSAAFAQTATPDTAKVPSDSERARMDINTLPVQTFYLNNVSQPNDGNEIQTAIRNILPPQVKIYYLPSENAITVRGTPDEFVQVQKLLNDLDRPKKNYRLTYTITEMDGGKRLSEQHFTLNPADGQRVTLKQGSKVPIATGTQNSNVGTQTQFQYLDVGMNFDATLTGFSGGGMLKTKVEQSSVADTQLITDVREPIIRQTALEGTSYLILGKPLVLGSIDIPGSTRHLDVEVMMELVK